MNLLPPPPPRTMPNRLTPAGIALIYAAFAALWIVASGYLLTLTVNDPLLQSRIELANGLVFVAVTSGLLYLLLKGWRESLGVATSMQEDDTRHPITRLVLLFIALALVVPLIGLAIVKLHGPQIEREAYSNLEAIARLKAEQIENWLAERQANGVALAAGTGLAAQVDQLVQQKQDARLAQHILARFDTLRSAYGYESILLLDASGRLLLASGEHADITAVLQNLLRQSLASKQVQRSNLYRSEFGHTHLDWVVPVVVAGPQGERQVAAVVLRTVPEHFLYPLIQTWPTNSASAETLLVRREGESALYLNELRHRKGTALTLRESLTTSLPGAVALHEVKSGTMQGHDYRSVSVLAAYRPVAGTDWHIVAKIDRDEVLAPLHQLALWVSLVAFAAIAVIMLALLLLWRQRAHSLAALTRSMALVEESERRFRAVAQSANDAIVTADSSGNIVGWNASAERLFGYTAAEINGQALTRLMPKRFRAPHREGLARVTAGGAPHMISKIVELTGQCKDGSEFPLELSLAQWQTTEGNFFTAIIRDITEQIKAEMALRDSEAQLRTVVENITEGLAVSDLDGQLLHFNRAALDMHGFSTLAECRLHLCEFADTFELSAMDGTVWTREQWPLARVLRGENPRDLEVRVRNIKARWQKIFSYGGTLVRDANGQPLMAVLTIADITERKAAEAKFSG